jgi:small subunit ribosomal protein S18
MQKKIVQKAKTCYYCVNGINEADYKDDQILRKFISSYGKIAPQRRSGLCAKHQRKVAMAVKRARFLALLPYTAR